MSASALVDRDGELATLRAFLDEIADGPARLVFSGEAGIGKTVLWQAGVEEARGRFRRVLTCRGMEAEASLSYAGLSDLLGDVLEEAAPSLAAPRRRALEVALLLVEPGEESVDAHAVGLAVRDVLEVLARGTPVLVALDDVQWLDPASAGVLEVAFRRLSREPIGVLATVRRADGVPIPFGFDESLPEQRLTVLQVGPLSLGALRRLLSDRLDMHLTRSEIGRVQQASGGNPFFALELGRELVRLQARPGVGQSLRIPAGLKEAVGGRLAQLPEETLDTLLVAAALARPTVEMVAAAHGDTERVRAAISAAVADEIVELDDTRVRFTHPLLASICYERAPVWKRREVHKALASAVTDVEERARHLTRGAEGPDAAVALELDRAAEHAGARGATASAAELYELAVRLTPNERTESRRRTLNAARYHRLAGDLERSAALLWELLSEAPPGVERADALYELLNSMAGDRRMRKRTV
jgi:predicted ATPase